MKLRYLSIVLASAAAGVHGMQEQSKKNGIEMRTQDGFITVPQNIVEQSVPLKTIQNMKNDNKFSRKYLLRDQSKLIMEKIIRDQKHIMAGNIDLEETPCEREDLLYCLVVSRRLKLNPLYEAYKKIASHALKK